MSLPLIKKQFIKHGLAVATASIMASTAYAGTNEQQEIQQLRAEVAELRALIQQKAATQKQIVAEQKARPVVWLLHLRWLWHKLLPHLRLLMQNQAG